jgi:hypothetical protein
MKKRIRAEKISIELPREGDHPWINIVVQIVIKDNDGNILNVLPRYDMIHKDAYEIATDITQAGDPVTQQMNTISVAGIDSALTNFVHKWLQEHYGGEVINNPETGFDELIIEEN